MKYFHNLTKVEQKVLAGLNTPVKIQNFLDVLPMNFAEDDPCFSPRDVLKYRSAHCMEGALFAAAALRYHGHRPLLLDLIATSKDEDHVVALFQIDGLWGAISKTNHAVLRYREPVYKTIRELALSYFHEYFLDNGRKTLRAYSRPFDLSKYTHLNWLTERDGLIDLIEAMADSPHYPIISRQQIKRLRKADQIEISAGKLVEWSRKQPAKRPKSGRKQ